MKHRVFILLFALASRFILPLGAQSKEPLVCQMVTADQVGMDGLNTAAIQQQLDFCGAANTTRTSVELSPAKGASFTSGPLYIPSNVVLWLDAGVTLHASTNPADFQRTAASRTQACDSSGAIPVCGTLDTVTTGCVALLNSCKTVNAGIGGPGTIEGHGWSALTGGPNKGTTWWALASAAKAANYAQSLNAPKMVSFQQSNNITLSDFTIDNAPLVHILLSKDANVAVSRLNIVTPTPDHTIGSFPYNSDGMDISGTSNVAIAGVDFSDGDDNIAVEGGGNGPVANIAVSNSTFRAGHGFSIGSPTRSGVTNVAASNIRFLGTDNGLRIKSDAANGGVVDQIVYNTVCMAGVKNPIVIDPYYSSATGNLIPMFKNVLIQGMYADGGNLTLEGFASQPPLDLTLNNVRIDNLGRVTAANANINEISDPNFPFPVPIPSASGVNVTRSQAPAPPPADIKSYCRPAPPPPITPTSTLVVDDAFADGNSQNQDLANNSLQLFNGRANNVRTDQVGSVTFDLTPAGTSSEGFWAFFTAAGSPIVLGVGDTLSVSATFSLSGFKNNGQDIRWGVLDSQGTRNTTNLNGGMNDATFIGDTGYGLQFYASGTGSPFVIGRRIVLSSANVFNNFGDFTPITGSGASARQALTDDTPYTLSYTIERLTSTDTRISAAVAGGTLSDLTYSAVETTATPNTSFDYFAFRIGGTNFTSKITFTELKVQYNPAPPVITSQPQPSSLTVQVGSNVTIAVGANGNQVTYEWQRNGQPIPGNASATTPTLNLVNVQHSDAGSYTVVVTNAGGSVTSNQVTLQVSDTPVPPSPTITTQPANTTVTLGNSTSLSVKATGDNLFYQWFKNGVLIPGGTASQLVFQNAQVGDSAAYTVVVSNSSGSISSAPATLLVVSAMSPIGFRPWNLQTAICNDTPLYIALDQPPQAGKTGRVKIFNSHGVLMDTIDMAANPQTRVIGGAPFVYYPVIVTGNIAAIYLHQSLPYNDTYSVTMEPGVITDSSGAPFAGFSDTHFWNFTVQPAAPAAGANALTVAFDGGDFCTVQGAIDFVPVNNTQPVAITVRQGAFTGIVYVPSNKPFITVRGEDRNGSILQYPNNNNINPSVSSRAAFGVDAPDFTLENITVHNTTPHGGSQAEAFRGNNKRILLNRVNLLSFQDTLMLQGAGMVTNSYIEGDVDFMWGTGTLYIQNSELKAVTSSGYYTQIRNGQGQNGYVFVNDRLTGAPGVSGVYLGRIDPTVFPYSQVVYINCAMGPHIIPVGWLLNNASTAPNVQFWEYQSTDLDGAPIDVSQRLADARQISPDQAAQWSDPAFVSGGWVPYTVNVNTSSVSAGAELIADWSAAMGHDGGDWIGLYAVGDPDASYVAMQYTGSATTGHLIFTAPTTPGQYEFRYFLSDGVTRAAASNRVTVQ